MFKPSQRVIDAIGAAFQIYWEEMITTAIDEISSGSEMKISKSAPASKKKRRKAPIQLCPVPGCKERAAPVFGMVCAKHKDVAKSKIKKYRADRIKKSEKVKVKAKK